MLTISPYGNGPQLKHISEEATELLAYVVSETQLCDSAARPFLQLSYQEISTEDIEMVLGYAGITAANAPVGLPADFELFQTDGDCLLFPLSGLEAHLRTSQPELIGEYEIHDSFEQFLESRDIAAREYLITGVIECINWCRKNQAALTIQW